jgi:hypothetical protein
MRPQADPSASSWSQSIGAFIRRPGGSSNGTVEVRSRGGASGPQPLLGAYPFSLAG